MLDRLPFVRLSSSFPSLFIQGGRSTHALAHCCAAPGTRDFLRIANSSIQPTPAQHACCLLVCSITSTCTLLPHQALLLPYLPAALEILVGPAAAAPATSAVGPNEVPDLTDVLALSTQLVSRCVRVYRLHQAPPALLLAAAACMLFGVVPCCWLLVLHLSFNRCRPMDGRLTAGYPATATATPWFVMCFFTASRHEPSLCVAVCVRAGSRSSWRPS